MELRLEVKRRGKGRREEKKGVEGGRKWEEGGSIRRGEGIEGERGNGRREEWREVERKREEGGVEGVEGGKKERGCGSDGRR